MTGINYIWSGIEKGSVLFSQLAIFAIFAANLDPDTFSVVVYLSVTLIFCKALIELGFLQSLIRQKKILLSHLIFTFTVSILMFLILYACSETIVLNFLTIFFTNVDLSIFRYVLLIAFLFSITSPLKSILLKEKKFKLVSLSYLISSIIAVSILLANLGSIATNKEFLFLNIYFFMHFVEFILIAISSLEFLKKMKGKIKIFPKEFFNFSFVNALVNIFNLFIDNIYVFITSQGFTQSSVSLIQQSKKYSSSLPNILSGVLSNVNIVNISNNRDKTTVISLLKNNLNFLIPLFLISSVVLFLISDFAVVYFFGVDWILMALFIKLLILHAINLPINSYLSSIITIYSTPRSFFLIESFKKGSFLLLVIFFGSISPIFFIITIIITSYISLFFQLIYLYYSHDLNLFRPLLKWFLSTHVIYSFFLVYEIAF